MSVGGTDGGTGAAAASRPTVPRWHLHRRLYDWVLHWAETPYGGPALFVLAFAESSFFPVPPDVLLAPLVLGNPRKWFRFALLCSLGSVAGGLAGYAIGWFVWQQIADSIYQLHLPHLNEQNFHKVARLYSEWNFWIVFTAGFTPLPYKVITISAGSFALSEAVANKGLFLAVFLVASAISRSARFFLVAGLFAWLGPRAKPFIDRYFNWLCLAFVILLVGGFVLIRYI